METSNQPMKPAAPLRKKFSVLIFFSRSALIPRRLLTLLAALSASVCLASDGEPLVIVVAGDGRAEYPWNLPPRPFDKDGMNMTVTTAIAKAVSTEKASILLWTGDIVNVNDSADGILKRGLVSWRNIMKQNCGDNVKLWPVRGNHEVYRYTDPHNYDGELIPNSKAVWKEVFPDLPQNDPKSEDGLSFYSVEGSALIVGLDEYASASSNALERKHTVNQTWLNEVLKQNQKPFTFVYGHEAAFMAGRHADDDTLAANARDRNLFLQSLLDAKALYFCGHDHFYDRMIVTRLSSPSGPRLFQITAGTAGAPFYPGGQYAGSAVWKEDRAAHLDNVYGYILIKVDGANATITFKGAPPSAFQNAAAVTFTPMDQIVCDDRGCKMIFCDGF